MRYEHDYTKEYILYENDMGQEEAVKLGAKIVIRELNKPLIGLSPGKTFTLNQYGRSRHEGTLPVIPWQTIRTRYQPDIWEF